MAPIATTNRPLPRTKPKLRNRITPATLVPDPDALEPSIPSYAQTDPASPQADSTGDGNDNDDNDDAFATFSRSKKDKLRVKRSTFLSKIQKPSQLAAATAQKRTRRPGKKLVATLEGLVDALPDDNEWEDEEILPTAASAAAASGSTGGPNGRTTGPRPGLAQANVMKMKSLKSRPGAMKKKAKLEAGERQRFELNMAQLAAAHDPSDASTGSTAAAAAAAAGVGETGSNAAAANAGHDVGDARAKKWAALRGFITQTMEQSPNFAK